MAGFAFVEVMPLGRAHEHEAPWQRGLVAEYLAVHQVAEAYEGTHQGYGHHETVKRPERTALRGEYREEYHGEHHAHHAAVAGQAAFPCVKYLNRVLRIIVPLVEEHMAQARAYHGAGGHPQQQYAQPSLGRALALEHFGHYIESYPESDGEHESVPPYRHRPAYERGVGVPNYIVKHLRSWILKFSVCRNNRGWRAARARSALLW